MATTFGVVPEVFGSMCRAAAPKVQGVNAQVLANTLWAMTTAFQGGRREVRGHLRRGPCWVQLRGYCVDLCR
ncbi:MAG: hypothetical protein QF828_09230, partial [Pseudomonadales bacterium]|nr:hypothetical protein [Pseudomonadales bacterium]